jgi:hypothetical protein
MKTPVNKEIKGAMDYKKTLRDLKKKIRIATKGK